MGILLDSSTPIELLLKNALLKENLEFREQQRIYERGNDLQPKYVVDFVVVFRDVSVIVECDGQAYHSSDADVRRDTARDCWLKRRGHKAVLHFTTHQLRYEMRTVILTIKHHLGIINIPKKTAEIPPEADKRELCHKSGRRKNAPSYAILRVYTGERQGLGCL